MTVARLQNQQKAKYVFEKQKQEPVSKMESSFLFRSVLTPEGTHADSYKGVLAGAAKENPPRKRSFDSYLNRQNGLVAGKGMLGVMAAVNWRSKTLP